MKNRSMGLLGRLSLNAVTLESLSPGSVVIEQESGRDPGTLRAARHSSMTLCDERRGGFTLMELLVVVLIIGILAAVALPQYRVAVERARVVKALPVLRSIMDARERTFLANGSYSTDLEDLDIGILYFQTRLRRRNGIRRNAYWIFQIAQRHLVCVCRVGYIDH